MSSLAKPQNRFTNSLTPNAIIPTEWVDSVDALTIPPIPPSATAKYVLVFNQVFPNGFAKRTEIPFATAAAMNTSLANYFTANVVSIA